MASDEATAAAATASATAVAGIGLPARRASSLSAALGGGVVGSAPATSIEQAAAPEQHRGQPSDSSATAADRPLTRTLTLDDLVKETTERDEQHHRHHQHQQETTEHHHHHDGGGGGGGGEGVSVIPKHPDADLGIAGAENERGDDGDNVDGGLGEVGAGAVVGRRRGRGRSKTFSDWTKTFCCP